MTCRCDLGDPGGHVVRGASLLLRCVDLLGICVQIGNTLSHSLYLNVEHSAAQQTTRTGSGLTKDHFGRFRSFKAVAYRFLRSNS